MTTKVKGILEGLKSFVEQALENREKYLTEAKWFTRNRVLGFNNLCYFLVCQSKRSLSIELGEFFRSLHQPPCSKGALCKARYRVRWEFFRDWHGQFVKAIYEDGRGLRRWKGFYLKAIDGTSIYLFKDEEVEKHFGGQSNQHVRIPMARGGIELDVLNGFCTGAQLQAYCLGESAFAEAFLEEASPQDLRIYDRYFASFELIFKHLHARVAFLMRCKLGFNGVVSRFVASGKKQSVVDFPIPQNALASLLQQGYEVDNPTTVRVRLLRIDIGQEQPEILITSLLDLKKYPHACFKELYGLRWGCETCMDQLKNKLQIEIFSGHRPPAIYQDFFATLIASNLHNLICTQCEGELVQINQIRQTPVAINHNVSIGLLKPRLVELFLTRNPVAILTSLKELFLTHLEPVRPGRSFPRTKTVRRLKGKFQTFKNYRRAA